MAGRMTLLMASVFTLLLNVKFLALMICTSLQQIFASHAMRWNILPEITTDATTEKDFGNAKQTLIKTGSSQMWTVIFILPLLSNLSQKTHSLFEMTPQGSILRRLPLGLLPMTP